MFDRTGKYLIYAILLGMILGVAFVAVFGEAGLQVKFLGDIFLNALKMVVIPLLFCSMIVGISNLGDVRKLGRTGLKTLAYFLVTSSVAVVIGLVLVNIIQPGADFPTIGTAVPGTVAGSESYSFFGWLAQQIPSNIISAASETKVLPIIVFALFFGGVLTTIGSKGRPVIAFFDGVNEAIMKIVHIIMWFAPIGIFGLVAGQLASVGGVSGFTSILSALGKYSLVVIVGLLIHGVIVLPLILKFFGGKSPLEYFSGMSQALLTAFATSSSSATLPVTMECVEEKNDIDKRASSFVLPLGATINMDGTALYEAVAALFIAQAYGINMPLWSQITISATAVLASIGAAGIPQAGLVTMVLVLQAVGLPIEGIGLILAVDWFLDRCRTTVNVWGDSVGAAVIATTAEIGIVDKRRRVAKKATSRSGKSKPTSRGSSAKGKRPRTEWTKKTSKERKPTKTQKTGATARKSSRRTDLPKKVEYTVSPVARKPHKVEATMDNRERDTYRPSQSNNAVSGNAVEKTGSLKDKKPILKESGKVVSEKRKDTVSEAKNGLNGRSSKAKDSRTSKNTTAFDRKRATTAQKKKSAKSVKELSNDGLPAIDTPSEGELVNLSSSESTFEVPKFPKNILDDLATSTEEAGMTNAKKNSEDSSRKADNGKSVETTSSADFSKEKVGATESEIKKDSDSDDFAKLDKAIFGITDKPDTLAEAKAEEGFSLPSMRSLGENDSIPKSVSKETRKKSSRSTKAAPANGSLKSEKKDADKKELTTSSKEEVSTKDLPTPDAKTSEKQEVSLPKEDSNDSSGKSNYAPDKPVFFTGDKKEKTEDKSSSDQTPLGKADADAPDSKQLSEATIEKKETPDSEDDQSLKEEAVSWGRTKQRRPNR